MSVPTNHILPFIFRADYSPILKNLSYSLSTRMPENKAAAGTDGDKGGKVRGRGSFRMDSQSLIRKDYLS